MRRLIFGIACVSILLSGCASNGSAINTMGNNQVDRVFINGSITKQQKVIIKDTELAALTGAGVGAVGGAAVGAMTNGGKGALLGAGLGAVGGAVVGGIAGKEVEAYQTVIKGDDGVIYQGYLEKRLTENSRVEFTVVDGKLKNVNVLSVTPQYK